MRACVRASAALLRARSGYGSTRRCTGYRGDPTWNALTQYLSTSVRQLRRDRRLGSISQKPRCAVEKRTGSAQYAARASGLSRLLLYLPSPPPALPSPSSLPPPPDCGTTRCCFDDRSTDRWRVYDLRSNSCDKCVIFCAA